MEKVLLTAKIKLVFRHQYHIGSGGAVAGFVDKHIIRDYKGRLVIPGSTLKGQLRHNAVLILPHLPWYERCSGDDHCQCIICRNFGKGGYTPGRLFFYDLVQNSQYDNVVIKTGVGINRKTRTGQHKALFMLEAGSSPAIGDDFGGFNGTVEGMVPADDVDRLAGLLYMAFRMIEAIGGEKSRGLGTVDHERSRCDFYIGNEKRLLAMEQIEQAMGEVTP